MASPAASVAHTNPKFAALLAEADKARDLRQWDALPPLAKKILKTTTPETGALYDALFTGETAVRKALAQWHSEISSNNKLLVEYTSTVLGAPFVSFPPPIPADKIPANALKMLEGCHLDDAKVVLSLLQSDANVEGALTKVTSTPPVVGNGATVIALEAHVAKAALQAKNGQAGEAIATLKAVQVFAAANKTNLLAGSASTAAVEQALVHLAVLEGGSNNSTGAEAALLSLLELPHVSDPAKRLFALSNYSLLVAQSPAFAELKGKPRKPEEHDEFKPQTAAVLDAVLWLKTIKDTVPQEAIEPAFFNALAVINVTAALPALVKAAEVGARIFSYNEHLAFVRARALIHCHKFHEAFAVVLGAKGKNELLAWMLTWLALVPLNTDLNTVIEYAEQGIELNPVGKFAPRFHHTLAIAYERLAGQAHNIDEKNRLHHAALNSLKAAKDLDGKSWEIEYHLALYYAHKRKINTAISYAKAALVLNESHPDLWNLLILLCTSNRDFAAADQFSLQALDRNKNDLGLFLTWSLVQGYLHGHQKEVSTIKLLFNKLQKAKRISDPSHAASSLANSNDAAAAAALAAAEAAALPPASLPKKKGTFGRSLGRLAGKKVQEANSSSSSNVNGPTASGSSLFHLQATPSSASITNGSVAGRVSIMSTDLLFDSQSVSETLLWTFAGHAYLKLGNLDDSLLCTRTAVSQDPSLPDTWSLYGELSEAQALKTDEILAYYDKALALHSTHVPSLVGSGRVLYKAGRLALALHHLTTAVSVDEHNPAAWLELGRVYRALGEPTTASDCLLRAFNEGRQSPVRPFAANWALHSGADAWAL